MNNVSSHQKARKKIYNGVNTLADIVTITLGAKGRNVAIAFEDYKGNIYKRDVIHDGVKVSKAVQLQDPHEDMGAAILREAAEKTVMEVGDGTTVTICLAQAIFNEAYSAIETGSDAVSIRLGLEEARTKLIHKLSTYALPITNPQHIAYISCQEEDTAELIAQAIATVGTEGIIRIEESKRNRTDVEYQQGMQFDKGYEHQYYITQPETQEAIAENPYILITDMSITSLEPLGKLLQEIHSQKRSLVIVSPSFSPEALALLIQNKVKGSLPNIAISAPSFGENQNAILEDIAILTGGTFLSHAAGYNLEDVTTKMLGGCDYVTSTATETLIVGGKGKITSRIAMIKSLLEKESDDFKREKLKERLGKLEGAIAIIHVGGYTEVEMKERKERIDDAVHATRAAITEGVVEGGEVIYLKLRDILNNTLAERILYRAFEKPFNKLIENAGLDSGVFRERIAKSKKSHKGIDIRDGKVKNMIEAGIIDPTAVIRSAITNSISVAISLLLTEAIVTPRGR